MDAPTVSGPGRPRPGRPRHGATLLLVSSLLLAVWGASAAIATDSLAEGVVDRIRFREIGPTKQGGRVVAFAVSPTDPYTFFVGAGPAGLWKTVNNGTTFRPVFDRQAVASIGDVAMAPSDPNVVWVGTGEANLRNSTYYGNGVYRSLDGGETWEHRGLEDSHHIGRVLVHPDDPQTVWVAAQGHLYTENAERGVYKTTDGGATWIRVLGIEVDGRQIGATEVVLDPTDSDTLYAVTYDRQRFPWTFRTAGPGSGIHKSTDGGATWRQLRDGLPGGMLGKIGIDVYERDPNILYATVDNQNSPGVTEADRWAELREGKQPAVPTIGHVIYRSDDAGDSWHQVSPEGDSIGSRSNYYGQIIVDPNDPDHLYVLDMRVWESRDGGRSWAYEIEYGGDNHVLWIDPADSRHMLMGYDYGMAITHDAGATWYHPDELGMAQVYAVGVDMERPYNVYCGMQDFGSWKGPSTKKGRFPIRFEDWEHINGGDGFYNQVDPEDSRWLYSGSQFGHITRIDQKTGRRQTIVDDGDPEHRFNWNTPLLVSPHDSKVLFVGAESLLRSDDRGESWTTVSPDLTRQDATKYDGIGAVRYGTVTTIDQSSLDAEILWVGTDDGNLWVSRNGGGDWVDRTAALTAAAGVDGYWVSRVEASHHDPATAYVTFTGLHRDDPRPLVFRSRDFGATWEAIGENLPAAAVNVIREDRRNADLLFLGNDVGVFVSLDAGSTWARMATGLPTVPVHDLVVHPRDNDLVVGTHGRGVYIADISPLQELTAEVADREAHLFEIEPAVQWVMTSQPAVSAQNFAGTNAPHGAVVNYYLRTERPEGVTIRVRQGEELLWESAGPGLAGLNRVEWGLASRRPRTPEEIEEWEREQEWLAEDVEFFDYYDTVEGFPEPGEEVDPRGRSLRTRVHRPPDATERDWYYARVPPGEYRVTLEVEGVVLERPIEVLADVWYDD